MQVQEKRKLPYRSLHFYPVEETPALKRFRKEARDEQGAIRLALALGMTGCGREATGILRALGLRSLKDPLWDAQIVRWFEARDWWEESGALFKAAVRRNRHGRAIDLLGDRGDSFWDRIDALEPFAALAAASGEPYLARHISRRIRFFRKTAAVAIWETGKAHFLGEAVQISLSSLATGKAHARPAGVSQSTLNMRATPHNTCPQKSTQPRMKYQIKAEVGSVQRPRPT